MEKKNESKTKRWKLNVLFDKIVTLAAFHFEMSELKAEALRNAAHVEFGNNKYTCTS